MSCSRLSIQKDESPSRAVLENNLAPFGDLVVLLLDDHALEHLYPGPQLAVLVRVRLAPFALVATCSVLNELLELGDLGLQFEQERVRGVGCDG